MLKNLKVKSNRKGFTIVELVIVIAVIAILAGVLIPTFANMIKNARISADSSLIRNINYVMNADEANNGAPKTAHDALAVAFANGYGLQQLSPTTDGYDIVWNSVTNRFGLFDEDGRLVYPKEMATKSADYTLWAIRTSYTAGEKYSIYLKDGYNGGAITATTGVDVGNNENIDITYNKAATAQTVTFRTNGGSFVVNADTDVVNHYSYIDSVKIVAVAEQSYHEYGMVRGNIEIIKGRIELAATASANTILVSSVTAGQVIVDLADGATIQAVAPTTDAAKEDISNATTIPATIKVEETVVSTDAAKFGGGIGTETNPYLLRTKQHFLNISNGTSATKKHYKLMSDVDMGYVGSGICHITETKNNIIIDGNNFTLKAQSALSYGIFNRLEYSTLKNLNCDVVDTLIINTAVFCVLENVKLYGEITILDGNCGLFCGFVIGRTVLKHCVNYAVASGTSYNAVFVGYTQAHDMTIEFENCINYGAFSCARAAFFLGNAYAERTTIIAKNCINNGLILGTTSANVVAATGNNIASLSFNYNDQTYTYNSTTKLINFDITKMTGAEKVLKMATDATLSLRLNVDNTFTVTAATNSNASYYVVEVGLYTNIVAGGTLKIFATQRIEKGGLVNNQANTAIKNLKFVDKTWVQNNPTAVASTLEGNPTYVLDDVTYYYIGEVAENVAITLGGQIKVATLINVYAYNSSNVLVASAALTK